MKFGKQIRCFDFDGTSMVANLENGYAIGLNGEANRLCRQMLANSVPEERITSVDSLLLEHLNRGCFFEGQAPTPKPLSAYLHVTQRCNLDCKGCYSFDETRNASSDPSQAQVFRAFDFLTNLNTQTLVISGGEPFLRSDLCDLVEHARLAMGNAKIAVLTNGTLLESGNLSPLTDYVDVVSVSFDGCSQSATAHIRGTQRFDMLKRSVELIQQAGISANILPTLHAKNLDDIDAYIDLAEKLGVSVSFSILSCVEENSPYGDLVPKKEELIALGEQAVSERKQPISLLDTPVSNSLTVKPYCGAGTTTLSIASDGTIYPCHMLHHSEFAMGNAFYDTAESVSEGEVRRKFSSIATSKVGTCSNCEYALLCGGGCRARAYAECGDILENDPYCPMFKAFYAKLGKHLKQLTSERRR